MTNGEDGRKMVEIEVDFTEEGISRGEERAKLMGISFEELVRQSVAGMLAGPSTEDHHETEG